MSDQKPTKVHRLLTKTRDRIYVSDKEPRFYEHSISNGGLMSLIKEGIERKVSMKNEENEQIKEAASKYDSIMEELSYFRRSLEVMKRELTRVLTLNDNLQKQLRDTYTLPAIQNEQTNEQTNEQVTEEQIKTLNQKLYAQYDDE